MDEDKHILEWVSEITELQEIADYLQDPQVDTALENVLKLIARITNGEPIEPQRAARLVALLQASAALAGLKATYYKTIGKMKDNSRTKMDMYKSFSFHMTGLVDAIKYLAK